MIDKQQLINDIQYHNYRYYVLNDPVISDEEYDIMYQQLVTLDKTDPGILRVGGSWKSPTKHITHVQPMLSLRSDRSSLNISAFFININSDIIGEPKIDGIAVEFIYENGNLIRASTRGDGLVGDDILTNIKYSSIKNQVYGDFTIYGELFILREDFAIINKHRKANGKLPYASLRHAASGIARSTSDRNLAHYLRFFPYSIYQLNDNHFDNIRALMDMFGTTDYMQYIACINHNQGIDDYIRHMIEIRDELPFDTDGLVFKVNSIAIQNELGSASTHPKWAMVYKFQSKSVGTRLVDITFQTGKSGIVCPVAELDPIIINGIKITRASLHNLDTIKRKDIRINDWVNVSLANDVIPYISDSIKEDRNGKEIEIEFPTHCPVCGTKLIFDGTNFRCTSEVCEAQVVGRLAFIFSNKCLNIKGLGIRLISDLVKFDLLGDFSDIFELARNEDAQINFIESTSHSMLTLDKICKSVAAMKSIPLDKFILALGIPNVNVGVASRVASYVSTIDNLLTYDLSNISGISEDTLSRIIDTVKRSEIKVLLGKLYEYGLSISDIVDVQYKPIAITGKFDIPRLDLIENLRKIGYKYVSNIPSSKCIIIGKDPSEKKLKLADKLNLIHVRGETWEIIQNCLKLLENR